MIGLIGRIQVMQDTWHDNSRQWCDYKVQFLNVFTGMMRLNFKILTWIIRLIELVSQI